MHASDLKALNAILDRLYFTETQIDVSDFCEFKLGIPDIRLHMRYAQWLVDQGYARPEAISANLLWITPKGRRQKEKGGIKSSRYSFKIDSWQKILGAISASLLIIASLYKFINWLIAYFQ